VRGSHEHHQPLGSGAIRDGFNQNWIWASGFGQSYRAPSNNGTGRISSVSIAPSPMRGAGQSTVLKFYYQWARPNTNLATIGIYLDDDLNPLNNNQTLLRELACLPMERRYQFRRDQHCFDRLKCGARNTLVLCENNRWRSNPLSVRT